MILRSFIQGATNQVPRIGHEWIFDSNVFTKKDLLQILAVDMIFVINQ